MNTPLIATAVLSFATAFASSNSDLPPVPELPTFTKSDAAEYGYQIAEYADRFNSGWVDELWQGRMELFDAHGDSVERHVLRMLLEGEEGDKSIVKFVSPAEIKGVAALTHEHPGSSDDNWLYLPATKRVRRISGANKTASFQGTEFTYEDLSVLDLGDFDWTFVEETMLERDGESVPVYVVEARPNYRDTGYSRLLIYYHREFWRQERIEYFDKAGVHRKSADSGKWEHMHGRFWRAFGLDMRNLQTGKRTLLTFDKVFLNLSLYISKRTGKGRPNLTDEVFTTRALENS